jgi:hypothetical protein
LNLAALIGELALSHSDLVAQVLQLRLDILSFILLFPFFLFEISVKVVVIPFLIKGDAVLISIPILERSNGLIALG